MFYEGAERLFYEGVERIFYEGVEKLFYEGAEMLFYEGAWERVSNYHGSLAKSVYDLQNQLGYKLFSLTPHNKLKQNET